jgi:hypothetical protein
LGRLAAGCHPFRSGLIVPAASRGGNSVGPAGPVCAKGAILADASSQSFVGTRQIDGYRIVEIDNALVVEAFAQLDRILTSRAGRNVAGLFAEPRITRGNGAAPTRIDWYARFEGVVRPLNQLDPSSAAAVRRVLESRLAALRPLAFDPECGPLVAAALNVASADSIVSVGGDPVLIDWGMLPSTVRDERAHARHFEATLAAFIPDLPLPPASRPEWAARFAGTGAAAARAPQSAPATAATAAAAHLPAPPARGPVSLRAPVIATVIAALVFGLLLVPGVLAFPADARRAVAASAAEGARGATAQLENRRRQLEAALAADCPALIRQAEALLAPSVTNAPPAATPVRK